MSRFIAFDVETPNSHNDRMSQIGLAVIEDGVICDTFSTLIDPETYFDYFNVMLTGITPEAVSSAPTFDKVWEAIGPVMQSGVLVAHNAPFDMGVLSKCLRAYCIDAPAILPYLCTVQLGRRAYPRLENHRLDTLCFNLDIQLDHHRADSDALACAKLLIDYEQKGLVLEDYIKAYDVAARKTVRSRPGF